MPTMFAMTVQDLFGIAVKETVRLQGLCLALECSSVPDSGVSDLVEKVSEGEEPKRSQLGEVDLNFSVFLSTDVACMQGHDCWPGSGCSRSAIRLTLRRE